MDEFLTESMTKARPSRTIVTEALETVARTVAEAASRVLRPFAATDPDQVATDPDQVLSMRHTRSRDMGSS